MPKQKQKQSQKVVVNITTSKTRTRARKSSPKTTVKAFEPRTIYNPPLSIYQTQPQSILQQHPDISKLHALVQSLVKPSVIVPQTEITVRHNNEEAIANKPKPKVHNAHVKPDETLYQGLDEPLYQAKPKPTIETIKHEHNQPVEPLILSAFNREPTLLEKPVEEMTFEQPRTKPPEFPTPTRITKHFSIVFDNPQDFREYLTELNNEELKSEAKKYNVKMSIQVQTEEINMRGRNIGKPKLRQKAKNKAEMIEEIIEARELEGY